MSVQFGRWNLDRQPIGAAYLERARSAISPYAPDGVHSYCGEDVAILCGALHTTKESRSEEQPHRLESGAIITWDGILDNRAQLVSDIDSTLSSDCTDREIVAAAYERWGKGCLSRFVGDWALAVWDDTASSLILAKDFLGVRPLYYSFDGDEISWSTILDPLVLLSRRRLSINEEYVAGWLSFNPAAHLTPYDGIHSVPPASYVLLNPMGRTVTKYWDFNPAKRLVYQDDREYEEHFRAAFSDSVRRRLRTDQPILAELSGGMDSSSIVCMADAVVASAIEEVPQVHTVSYYNDSEPNWNERPYFAKVEEKRGRTGYHIDLISLEMFRFALSDHAFDATPVRTSGRMNDATREFSSVLRSCGARVVLSGMGGDEILGGVPTPTPEIQDLLTQLRARDLAHQLKVWALSLRMPWVHLLAEAVRGFLPLVLMSQPRYRRAAPWLNRRFVSRNRAALQGYEHRLHLIGPPPSFQVNMSGLETLRRQVAARAPSSEPPHEYRYPYLDRDFLEFVYSIPRQQLIRPGERRSLMRRALEGIVPEEILKRRRKAFASRGPRAAISSEWPKLSELARDMSGSWLEKDSFIACLQNVVNDERVPLTHLVRTIYGEAWLSNLRLHGVAISA